MKTSLSQNTIGVKSRRNIEWFSVTTPLESHHRAIDNGVISEQHWCPARGVTEKCILSEYNWSQITEDCDLCSLNTPLGESQVGLRTMFSHNTIKVKLQWGLRMEFSQNTIWVKSQGSEKCVLSEHHFFLLRGETENRVLQNPVGVKSQRELRMEFSQNTIGVKSHGSENCVLSEHYFCPLTWRLKTVFSRTWLASNHRGYWECCSFWTPFDSYHSSDWERSSLTTPL